jgi:hypothetical protein
MDVQQTIDHHKMISTKDGWVIHLINATISPSSALCLIFVCYVGYVEKQQSFGWMDRWLFIMFFCSGFLVAIVAFLLRQTIDYFIETRLSITHVIHT